MENEKNLESRIRDRIVLIIVLLVGSYISLNIAGQTSAFLMDFVPDIIYEWFDNNDASHFPFGVVTFIGYSFSGYLFGVGLWLIFKKSASNIVFYVPVSLIFTKLFPIHFFPRKGANPGTFSAYNDIVYLMTSEHGFMLLVVIPAAIFFTLRYLNKIPD